jgi:serine/threonine-protein kinase
MFSAGDIVAGKFQIERVIGQGGMGVVVAATHIHLGQRVALKFLLPQLSTDRAVVERFLREARSSAQLRGEHICRVSDVGMLDSGAPYFVMELLEGRDLASILVERGPLPVAILADYVVQACLGLAEAHAAQIVHRDLKPANLFLTFRPDGSPLIKIVDFGIAKASAADPGFRITRTDAVMGSPGYMSPEQLRSSRIADARSDIWALGVILFELSSGRPPFAAESITDLALRIAVDPTPQLRTPPGFDHVVYRCLEKDPARRFQDVGQLAMALAPFGGPMVRERAVGATRLLSAVPRASTAPPEVATPGVPTTLGSSAVGLERARGDRLRWGIVVGALAAGALGMVVFLKLRGGDTHVSIVAAPATSPAPVAVDAAIQAEPTTPSPTAAAPAAVPAAVPIDAAESVTRLPPVDAARPIDASPIDAAVDAVSRPHVAPPVRKVTGSSPPVRKGSDDELEGSRK